MGATSKTALAVPLSKTLSTFLLQRPAFIWPAACTGRLPVRTVRSWMCVERVMAEVWRVSAYSSISLGSSASEGQGKKFHRPLGSGPVVRNSEHSSFQQVCKSGREPLKKKSQTLAGPPALLCHIFQLSFWMLSRLSPAVSLPARPG